MAKRAPVSYLLKTSAYPDSPIGERGDGVVGGSVRGSRWDRMCSLFGRAPGFMRDLAVVTGGTVERKGIRGARIAGRGAEPVLPGVTASTSEHGSTVFSVDAKINPAAAVAALALLAAGQPSASRTYAEGPGELLGGLLPEGAKEVWEEALDPSQKSPAEVAATLVYRGIQGVLERQSRKA